MPLFAENIPIDETLRANLGGTGSFGSAQKNSITDLYNRIRGNFNADARTRGVAPGSYADSRLGAGEGLAQQGLQTSLESVLGDTAYQNFKGERGYTQNSTLARQIGALNKGSTLEDVLGALGVAGRVGGGIYGAYSNTPRPAPAYGEIPEWALGNRHSYGQDEGYF